MGTPSPVQRSQDSQLSCSKLFKSELCSCGRSAMIVYVSKEFRTIPDGGTRQCRCGDGKTESGRIR
jgi:hypothetical protein